MKKLLVFLLLVSHGVFAQKSAAFQKTNYNSYFKAAYQQNPNIPKGMLEAVAWTMTHINHIDSTEMPSCIGIPRVYGIMGLTLNGQNYFRNNLQEVSQLSGISQNDIINNPKKNILAFAKAYSTLLSQQKIKSQKPEDHISVLVGLSELPITKNLQGNYALNSHLYSVLSFLDDVQMQAKYSFPKHNVDLVKVFGATNLQILSSPKITISNNSIQNQKGANYTPVLPNPMSPDYAPALWDPVPSCNFSSRAGTPISAITIHTIQGTYAGAISWAKNCSSNVSYHYVVRSSDGQVTQLVYESDKGWHVGSENPYTIGYEHDGYISDPSYYTMALFTASAGISKDVVNSGYGINPLRTYWGPSCTGGSSACQLGNCIKIKGHQHYPNQSHTDPGQYWDWWLYYNLINDSTNISTQTSATGTFYDSGGAAGNYGDDERMLWLIQPTSATSVTLTFTAFDLELNWDYLFIYDGSSVNDPLIGQYTGTISPGVITSSGGSLLAEFRSDCATTNPGWAANWTSNISPSATDSIPPTTSVVLPSNWVTNDFTTTFNDSDNVGVEQYFYQVIDFDGTEWRANSNSGFFSDNFDVAIHSDWTVATGTWAITNGYLNQTDEGIGQTNLYALLNQTSGNSYLYNWSANMQSGASTNKRHGIHFFSDNGALPNGGNSYFVYFREDNDKCQIYKVVSDTWTLQTDDVVVINADTWYDYKVIYNPSSGKIDAYVNNVLASTWTDSTPITSGSYSFIRTGNANTLFNDLKIYKSRGSSELVTVGGGVNDDIRYQNPNPTTPSARVKSIVIDTAENFSSIGFQDVNVDWTAPADVSTVNDGPGSDIDTTYLFTELSANWTTSSDTNSDVSAYWYAVGSNPGDSNVVAWTDNWFNASVTDTGLSLSVGQTYYYSVKALNGAGLFSNVTNSNGQYLASPIPPPTAAFSNSSTTICDGETVNFTNSSVDATSYLWTFENGNPDTSTQSNPSVLYDSSGTFDVTLIAYSSGNTSDTLIQNITVNVSYSPVVTFSTNDTVVYLPNATVNFTNNSLNATNYYWTFGDGNISSSVNPTYTYADTGWYTVSLIAGNGVCPDNSVVYSNYIYVGDSASTPPPTANFSYSSATICVNDSIQFTNNSNYATSYFWTFQNGSPATSTTTNPSVSYSTSGTYNVTLIATGVNSSDTISQSITVSVSQPPSAGFSASDTVIYLPNATVSFTNSSSNASSYLWDFGDSTTTDTMQNPTHIYTSAGSYSVTLIATNGQCPDDTMMLTNYIQVIDTSVQPIANFTYSSASICAGDSIQFTNTSTNATSYLWTFQNGSPATSTTTNPSVSYSASGTYNVTLIATGVSSSDTISQSITVSVSQPPSAGFSASDTVVYLPNA
ncbi:MAG: hypothetical protein COA57_15885, partial [Flavobacteriales bacterium]